MNLYYTRLQTKFIEILILTGVYLCSHVTLEEEVRDYQKLLTYNKW